MRAHVVLAVFRRNFRSYFAGILGFLFIVVFVGLGGYCAFREEFFAHNLANLDQLNQFYPLLLLFIVPAITMGAWAEERKLGTEELLFTLPVADLEVLLGKYLAVVAVYTVALLFSLSHVVVLAVLGSPDYGVLAANYLGYWLAGSSLLAVGLVGSYLTNSSTVGFVFGGVLCAIPTFLGALFGGLTSSVQTLIGFQGNHLTNPLDEFSLAAILRPFGLGLVPVRSVAYFVALAAFMLFINLVLIGRRNWRAGSGMMLHTLIRGASLGVALICAAVVFGRSQWQSDLTTGHNFSLSTTTIKILSNIPKERSILIQAFVSRDLPGEYAPVRTKLEGLLSQFAQYSRGRVAVRLVPVDPFSSEADEAQRLGIESRQVQTERAGRFMKANIVLGATVSSGAEDIVIPFFDVGTPLEYELGRSVGTAAREVRRTIGVLETDARVGGGFDMSGGFRSIPEWQLIRELKKQYQVEQVSAKGPIDSSKFDVLIAVMPSSLSPEEMTYFVQFVKTGHPVLILDDPFPGVNPQVAPRQPKPSPGGNPFMGGPPPGQKADGGKATSLTNVLGIEWIYDQVVSDDSFELLHPEWADRVYPEMIAISPDSGKNGAQTSLNRTSPITKDLREVLMFFAGVIKPRQGCKHQFTSLLRTNNHSKLISWDKLVQSSFMGIQLKEDRLGTDENYEHITAAHIKSPDDAPGDRVNVIYVADTDLISDWFFSIRESANFNLQLDNVTFVLNAVDFLAKDTSYLELRAKQVRPPRLTLIEKFAQSYTAERDKQANIANEKAEGELKKANERLKEKVSKIESDESLDQLSRAIQLQVAQQDEQRRMDVAQAQIEKEKKTAQDKAKSLAEKKKRLLEVRASGLAVLCAPLPAILIALILWLQRVSLEDREIPTRRRK